MNWKIILTKSWPGFANLDTLRGRALTFHYAPWWVPLLRYVDKEEQKGHRLQHPNAPDFGSSGLTQNPFVSQKTQRRPRFQSVPPGNLLEMLCLRCCKPSMPLPTMASRQERLPASRSFRNCFGLIWSELIIYRRSS